jgi:DOMON domain/PEP-CTERM motif
MKSGFTRTVARWATGVALVCSASTALASAGGAGGPGPCGPESTFSPSSDYSFSFRVCGESLFGTVTARAVGWVAVGFGRDQYMPLTDVFMAGVRPDGTTYGVDAFVTQRIAPVADASQDVILLAATEVGGVTQYSFTRPLRTGDAVGDFDLTDGEYHVLGAFESIDDGLTVRHSFADASDMPYSFAPVPEPASLVMLLAGLGLLAGRLRPR